MNMIARFAKDESGATAIEYGLIAALVAVAIIAALQDFSVSGPVPTLMPVLIWFVLLLIETHLWTNSTFPYR